MDADEIHRRLQAVFRDVFDRDDIVITRSTTSADIEDWDSLANISVVVATEKEFNIKLSLKEIQSLQNVGGMLDLVAAKVTS